MIVLSLEVGKAGCPGPPAGNGPHRCSPGAAVLKQLCLICYSGEGLLTTYP